MTYMKSGVFRFFICIYKQVYVKIKIDQGVLITEIILNPKNH